MSFNHGQEVDKKLQYNPLISPINQIVCDGIDLGLGHLSTQDEEFCGRMITLKGEQKLNFSSCSYLGLELSETLKEGVINAVNKYGTQYSSSRAYTSHGLYVELEGLLGELFGAKALVTPTTTLGHLAVLPTLISSDDLILLDHQVHASVQQAARLLKSYGVKTEVVPHNDLESLKKIIKEGKNSYRQIWYLIDGVYSMYGDFAPLKELEKLLNQEAKFHLYVDDAHGMSWAGNDGKGYALSQIDLHKKMVLGTSLNKAFASAGGVFIFGDDRLCDLVRNCGGPLIFSGPIQPPMLGAAIESARIHMSDKIKKLQQKLQDNIQYCNYLLKEAKLPLLVENEGPIFFIATGLPRVTYNLVTRLLNDGMYTNPGIFPAVPMKKGGVRFTLTAHHEFADIKLLVDRLAHHYPQTLEEEGVSYEQLRLDFEHFNLPETVGTDSSSKVALNELKLTTYPSINEISQDEWDRYFKCVGVDSYTGLLEQEETFQKGEISGPNDWKFQYIKIVDDQEEVIFMSYFTTTIVKDDMLNEAEVSEKIEDSRYDNKMLLTSKTVMLGSLVSEGSFYLNKENKNWEKAIGLLVNHLDLYRIKEKASSVMFRGFVGEIDEVFQKTMLDLGFVKVDLPQTHLINDLSFTDLDDFLSRLGQKYRYNVRKEILKYEDLFEIDYSKDKTQEEIKYAYNLYLNVKKKSFEINTFDLPFEYFCQMFKKDHWDIMFLYLKEDGPIFEDGKKKPVAVLFSYIDPVNYSAKFIGLDYNYLYTHKIYKQALFKSVFRAKELKKKNIQLGFTATLEKKKLGARVIDSSAFIQIKDHYNHDVIATKY